MKSSLRKPLVKSGTLLGLAMAGILSGGAAHAAPIGTASGVDITNTATLAYSVSGTPPTPVPSNETSFKVDNKVNVLVAESGGTVTNVVPGAQDQVTTFTVTNNGNTSQGYNLLATVGTAGAISGTTSSFAATRSGCSPTPTAAVRTARAIRW